MFNFSKASLANRERLHPDLKRLVDEMIKEIDFKILDSTRGRAAQTKAFLTKKSKARFGDSAHNYEPAIAVDLFPAPYLWEGKEADAAFSRMYQVAMKCAKRLGVPIRSGRDWNMDGDKKGDKDNWDGPHIELHPWREWAKKSKLYED